MNLRLRLLVLIGLVLHLAAGRVAAADLVVERAYFEDVDGSMSFEQVQRASFTRTGKVTSLGFTRSALWLRLTVDQPVTDQPLILSLQPATLEAVTLYSPEPGVALSAPAIELRPMRLWRHQWEDTKPGIRVRYLRIKSAGAMIVSAEIATESSALEAESWRSVWLGGVLGCTLPILMAVLVLVSIQREPVYMSGLLTVMASTFVNLLMYGHLHDFSQPFAWLHSEMALHLAVLLNLLGGYLMIYYILCKSQMPRWGYWLNVVFNGLFIAMMAASILFDLQLIRTLACVAGLVAGMGYAALSVSVLVNPGVPRHPIYLVPLAFSLMAALGCAQWLDLIAPRDWSLESFAWRSLAAPVLFCLVIWTVELERRSLLRLANNGEEKARQSFMQESARRSLQERFVTTLMHEIKTPLATIQLAAASLNRDKVDDADRRTRIQNIDRSVNDLNGIVECYVQMDQFENGKISFTKQEFTLYLLLKDVAHSLGGECAVVSGEQGLVVNSDFQGARLVMLNLLSNARKYKPPGSNVACEIEPAERLGQAGVRLRVVNEVSFAGSPDLSKVFSRYYRSEGARRISGAGLGLWLSQETARAMGTEITFSTPDRRVCFDLWLALA